MAFLEQVQMCGVFGAGAAVWRFRCRFRVLGAGAAVWVFKGRCSCVAFLEQEQLCGVLGVDSGF